MEKYIGVKEILAQPMKRGEYKNYMGLKLTKTENPEDEGFLVEHIGLTRTNHPNHANRVSWLSTKDFKKSHAALKTHIDPIQLLGSTMYNPVQNRIFNDYSSIVSKIENTKKTNELDVKVSSDAEKARIEAQLLAMEAYAAILRERIENKFQ
jgi:hypothetical protein